MFGILDKYIVVFLTGFLVTYVFTPLARGLALRLNIVDMPDARRTHRRPTPRGGGLAVVLGVHAACLMALVFPWPKMAGGLDLVWYRNFILASLILLIVGLVDDVRGLKPWVKLAGQAAAAFCISISGTRFGSLFGFELPWFLDCFFVVVWLVAVINAFNLIDGLDGLASGLAITSAIGLGGVFFLGRLPGDVLPLVGLVGACLAFLRYNSHPASIFLGDTGSMFLGFILGVVSLKTFNKNTFILSLTIPMLVLGVPIFDALLAIWRRSVRRWLADGSPGANPARRGIMQPDVEHLHHRLLKAGLSTPRVAALLCAGNAILVTFSLLITIFKSHATGIFLIALLAGAYVLLRHLAVLELRDTGQALLAGLRRPSHSMLKNLAYPVWDMTCMTGALALAMWVFEPPRMGFWHDWFLDLPVWVTPTFTLLAISRTYQIVWARARTRDVFMLIVTLGLGLLLSLGIALLIDPYNNLDKWLLRTLVLGALSHSLILGARMVYWVVEALAIWPWSQNEFNPNSERVVLYGAGGRCQLFLRERGFNPSRKADDRIIVGLIDDEPSLRSQWVYGHMVLGGRTDLPRLIGPHRITGIIITAGLTPEARAAVRELAVKHRVMLAEWGFVERPVGLPEIEEEKLCEKHF